MTGQRRDHAKRRSALRLLPNRRRFQLTLPAFALDVQDYEMDGSTAISLKFLRRPDPLVGSRWAPSAVQRLPQAVDKTPSLEVEGFMQETNCSPIQRSCLNGVVRIGSQENDRYIKALMSQLFLQLQAVHVRHLHVRNQTAGHLDHR